MANGDALPSVGDWTGRSFRGLSGSWITLTALGIVGTVVTAISVALVYGLAVLALGFLQGFEFLGRLGDPEQLSWFLHDETNGTLFRVLNLVAMLVAIRIGAWFALAHVHAACDHSLGFFGALRAAKPRSLPFIGLAIVHQLAVGLATMALIIPGIVVGLWFSMAALTFAREDLGVLASFGRSRQLVKGRGFAVLGRLLLMSIVCTLIMIVPIAGWIVGPALAWVAWATLYEDLRGCEAHATTQPAQMAA